MSTKEQPPSSKASKIKQEIIDINNLIRDSGKRSPIWNYPVNQQDEIHRTYIKFGPYPFFMDVYPLSSQNNNHPRFQACWFKFFLWQEYSPEEDVVFCFPCYLFSKKIKFFLLQKDLEIEKKYIVETIVHFHVMWEKKS